MQPHRLILFLVLAVGCKDKSKPPAPAAASGSVVAVAADAAAIDAPIVVDAALAQKAAITVTGVGKLEKFAWGKQAEDETAKLIQDALASDLPDIKTSFEVMDVPGEVEREEGYWGVRRGDKELVQVLRRSDPEKELPAAILVWTPEIATTDGTKVGDKMGGVIAKHPDIICENVPDGLIAETVAADIQCKRPTEASIVYILDPNKKKLKIGKLATKSLAEVPIVAIASLPN